MTSTTKTVTFTSKKSKLITALKAGEALTASQITSRFGIANPRAAVSDLRMDGFAIYFNNGTKDARGRVRASRYRLGNASRAVIAAGYQALAAQKSLGVSN